MQNVLIFCITKDNVHINSEFYSQYLLCRLTSLLYRGLMLSSFRKGNELLIIAKHHWM